MDQNELPLSVLGLVVITVVTTPIAFVSLDWLLSAGGETAPLVLAVAVGVLLARVAVIGLLTRLRWSSYLLGLSFYGFVMFLHGAFLAVYGVPGALLMVAEGVLGVVLVSSEKETFKSWQTDRQLPSLPSLPSISSH